jgi:hypothetical protein
VLCTGWPAALDHINSVTLVLCIDWPTAFVQINSVTLVLCIDWPTALVQINSVTLVLCTHDCSVRVAAQTGTSTVLQTTERDETSGRWGNVHMYRVFEYTNNIRRIMTSAKF